MPNTNPTDANPDNFGKIATDTVDAGIADETAGYDEAMDRAEPQDGEDVADSVTGNGTKATPTEGGDAEIESAAQPS